MKRYRIKLSARRWLCADREAWQLGDCLQIYVVSCARDATTFTFSEAIAVQCVYNVMTRRNGEIVEA